MMFYLNTLLWLMAATLAVPAAVLSAECLVALLPRRRSTAAVPSPRPRVAVIVPAHNESGGLPATLATVDAAKQPADRVIVVADNCADDTAAVARRCGADVVERHDLDRRGKGYALDAGVRHVAATGGADVVAMVDADCELDPAALDALIAQVVATGRPAQAVYLMLPPAGHTGAKQAVSTLAFLVKNWVRPRGLSLLGGPCLLTGSGMAFPWSILSRLDLASGEIVEDTKMGLDLALAGTAPRLCEAARVTGRFPADAAAARTQRQRWTHGHLQTGVVSLPARLWTACAHGRLSAAVLAVEAAIPPLSLLMVLIAAGLAACGLATLAGAARGPAWLLLAVVAVVTLAVAAARLRFARRLVPLAALAGVPLYVLWKLPIFATFAYRRQRRWVATPRDAVAPATPAPTGTVADPKRPAPATVSG